MKVLLFNGSPRGEGCTYTALTEAEKTLREEGIDTEIFSVGKKPILGCIMNRVKFDTISSKKYYNKGYYHHYTSGYYKHDDSKDKK